jgi:lipopolysaccharide biosynthesis regulator YciM
MVKHENYFFLENGDVLKTVKALAFNLDTMSDQLFSAHVNPSKDDFANWIEHVFEGKELADRLRQVKDKRDYQILLLKGLLKSKTKKVKKYKCDKCGKHYDSKVGLSVHKTIAHKKG